ncbi:hypothetical protein BT96DRAFT_967239 [Gymnopus androsaceus JB14]|uniref:Ubiquitin-like domain-containing protein n=1 Tax=Gymnopus androsaceus JB14 TaxID=1447944 RepID=A0A6A4H684_9AGAR|nr:hypothetical protein BT96DRAFT_967239 [Gymnopus androsaceus JB14]
MADQAEHAFIKTFVNTISTQAVTYDDEYQQPPENSLKRVPILPIDVPLPPVIKEPAASSSSATLTLTIKSTKPPITYTLSGIHPTDTIAAIKQHLIATNPNAPAPDVQRLLLKGKALADNKLLKEYTVKDGDTINLMVKPGVEWNPSAPSAPSIQTPQPSSLPISSSTGSLSGSVSGGGKKHSHQRIPSVVLSPSPSTMSSMPIQRQRRLWRCPERDFGLVSFDDIEPAFWERMIGFLRSEFTREADALTAFEDFLAASKGSLTASDIAKIRDQVGVVGMAGT